MLWVSFKTGRTKRSKSKEAVSAFVFLITVAVIASRDKRIGYQKRLLDFWEVKNLDDGRIFDL